MSKAKRVAQANRRRAFVLRVGESVFPTTTESAASLLLFTQLARRRRKHGR